jgi:cbb3-type cytochrome oxidase subunit 1
MPRVSAAFYTIAVFYLIVGMIGGLIMGAHEDFALAPAHAHLNLLGWATTALYGTFYALTRETYSPRLAWVQFVVSAAGVLIMVPSLTLVLTDHTGFGAAIGIGGMLALIGLLIFAVSVVRELLRKRA